MSVRSTVALSGIVVLVIGASWWFLFRSVEVDLGGQRAELKRVFGRVVAVDVDSNRDGRFDAHIQYSWAVPYDGIICGVGCFEHGLHSEDRNYDGRWDTWYEAVEQGPDPCRYSIAADMDLDGTADFRTESEDLASVLLEVKEQRGF